MADYSGTMTEIKRVDNDGAPSVVVSYWTTDGGDVFEPRLRFVLGEKNRPIKGLTRAQALAVRDAFNAVLDDWGTPSAPKKQATKSRAKSKAKSTKAGATPKAAAELAAADAIADMFKSKSA